MYCLSHKDTGRYYIGYTEDLKRRFAQHASPKRAPRKMRADVRACLRRKAANFADCFEVAVLAEAPSKAAARALEEYFIWKWRADEVGYNTRRSASEPI